MHKLLKWSGRGILVVVVLLALVAAGSFAAARAKLGQRHEVTTVPLPPGDAARGRHLAQIHGCESCHGPGLGGQRWLDIAPALVVAPNLTSGAGGLGARYSREDFDRAVRQGVRPDGQWLWPFMPYPLYHGLDDQDAADLASYLVALPPVDNEVGRSALRPLGYAMVAFADWQSLPASLPARGPVVAPAPSAEYGRYLAATVCAECHGSTLHGGRHPAPQAPPGPDLSHTALWTPQQFAAAVRTGRVGGRSLDPWMPSKGQLVHLDDIEVAALHAYLRDPARRAAP